MRFRFISAELEAWQFNPGEALPDWLQRSINHGVIARADDDALDIKPYPEARWMRVLHGEWVVKLPNLGYGILTKRLFNVICAPSGELESDVQSDQRSVAQRIERVNDDLACALRWLQQMVGPQRLVREVDLQVLRLAVERVVDRFQRLAIDLRQEQSDKQENQR